MFLTAGFWGKFLVCAGLAAWGVCASVRLKSRVGCLRDLLAAVEYFERELAFSLPRVESLLRGAARTFGGVLSAFFAAVADAFSQSGGEGLAELWPAQTEAAKLPLSGAERQLFQEIGGVLGRYDGESQRQALRRIHARLEEQLTQAREESDRLGRVYPTLGVTLGIFCGILL
jgi:stage III sporulation protein AB